MTANTRPEDSQTALAGARIWLSGALPNAEEASAPEREALLAFVRHFARRVFASGGHIVHGSHPSLTPVLLEEARRARADGGSGRPRGARNRGSRASQVALFERRHGDPVGAVRLTHRRWAAAFGPGSNPS